MTDKELLELAAKAAGIAGWQSKHGYWNMTNIDGESVVCCNDWPKFDSSTGEELNPTFADAVLELNWNPLTDDGDALRLVNRLCLCIEHGYCADDAPVVRCGHLEDREEWPMVPAFPDPGAAVRRAIVEAAAEIGLAV